MDINAYETLIKTELDKISTTINTLRSTHSPSGLSGVEKEVYDLLKTGPYPTENIDLYGFFKNKALKTYTLQ